MPIVCPDCSNQLVFNAYERLVISKRICAKTGNLLSKTTKTSEGNEENLGFISCSHCDWEIHDGMDGYYSFIHLLNEKDLDDLFGIINKSKD